MRWSLRVFRMDTGVSARVPTESVQVRTCHHALPAPLVLTSGPSLCSFPTFDSEPGRGAHGLGREGNGACVLQAEVGQGETVHPAVGADPHLASWLDPETVLVPHALHVGMGQFHLERGRLPLQHLLVAQVPLDGDLAGWRGRGDTKLKVSNPFLFFVSVVKDPLSHSSLKKTKKKTNGQIIQFKLLSKDT